MTSKISFQCQAIPQQYEAMLATNPVSVKFLGSALNEDAIRKVPANSLVILRRAGGDEDFTRDPVNEAIAWANETFHILTPYLRIRPNAIVETINEPNPTVVHNNVIDRAASIELAKKLNTYQAACAERLRFLGVQKVGAYQFSVGQPPCRQFNGDDTLWPYLLDGIRASDYLLLHEYSAPRMSSMGSAYCLRYRHVLAELATFGVRPRIGITENGIDRGVIAGKLGGYRDPENHTTIDDYVSDLQWYANQIAADGALEFAHVFLAGRSDDKWKTFDVADEDPDREKFIAFLRWTSSVTPVPPDPPDPPNPGDKVITPAETIATMPFLVKRAVQLDLGPSIYGEYTAFAANGDAYHCWIWQRGGLRVKDGDYGSLSNAVLFNPQTGEPMAQPLPWPGGGVTPVPPPTPTKRITTSDLPPEFGIIVQSYVPAKGEKFFGLVGAGNFKSGPNVGTQTTLQAANEQGSLAVGFQLTHAFDNTNRKSETFPSPSVGIVLGPGSYYNPGATPPDRFYVSKGPTPEGTWPTPYPCDIVLAGMPSGQHFEATYTWQMLTG